MKTLVLILLLHAVVIRGKYIFYDNEDAIITESGTSAVIGCTFIYPAGFKPTSVILMKCESRPACGVDDVIFDSEDVHAAKGPFTLLEPDLSKKNCSIHISDLKLSMIGSYQIGVNGQWNGGPYWIRTIRKKLILVTDSQKMESLTVATGVLAGVLAGVVALMAIFHCIRCRKSCRGLRDQAEATEMVIPQDQQTGGRQVDGFDEQTFQDEGVAASLLLVPPPPSPSTTSSSSTPPPDFKPPPPPRHVRRLQTSMMRPPYAQGELPPPPPPPPQCFPQLQTAMIPPSAQGELPPPSPSTTSSSSTPPPDFKPPPPPQRFPRLQSSMMHLLSPQGELPSPSPSTTSSSPWPIPLCSSPPTAIGSPSLRGQDPVLHQSPAEVDLPLLHQSPAEVDLPLLHQSPAEVDLPLLHQSPAEVDLPLLHQSPASVKRGRRVTFAAASSSSRRRAKVCFPVPLSTTDEDEPCQSAYF